MSNCALAACALGYPSENVSRRDAATSDRFRTGQTTAVFSDS